MFGARTYEKEREKESVHSDNMAAGGIGDNAIAFNSII